MSRIETIEALEAIYGHPGETSLVKEVAVIIPHYRKFIEASPFCTLATSGPEGLDCSPRGDRPGFVRVADEKTLLMPDRRGNNRCDSLRNIIHDPRVALCFLIPGSHTTLRVNGEAHLSVDPDLLQSFAIDEKPPRSVVAIHPRAIYFQCGRAVLRSRLWASESQVDPASLPSPGEVLAHLSENRVGGKTYDDAWQDRAEKSLW